MPPSTLNRPFHKLLTLFQRVADAAILFATLGLSTQLMDVNWVHEYSLAGLVTIMLFLIISSPAGLYERSWRSVTFSTEVTRVLHIWIWVILGLLIIAYATKTSTIYSRRAITTWLVIAPALIISWRLIAQLLLNRIRSMDKNIRRVAIAGAGPMGIQLARAISNHPGTGIQASAFYDDKLEHGYKPDDQLDVSVAGTLDDLIQEIKKGSYDEIYLTLPMHAENRIRNVLAELADTSVPVFMVPDLFAFTLLHARMSDIAGIPLISIYGTPHQGMGGIAKRIEDVVLSVLILTLIAVPMIVIASAVKLTSSGPILFKQRRYGLGSEEIVIWKFRTMAVCEDDNSIVQATQNDPRVTKLGRFLRRSSLDELPQFINVLQGHMSIVGPRPHAVTHNEVYRKLIQGYMLRHIVKPGITGWAQINGWRGETETLDKMEKRIEYDLEYIRQWSLWFDLKIIFLTPIRGMFSKKAF